MSAEGYTPRMPMDALSLRYSGPDVDEGRMDAYEAAGNIIAFTDFLSAVAKAVYGNRAELKTQIRAFAPGSFSVQFALELGGVLATLFSGPTNPKDFYAAIRHAFAAWKHLKGGDIKSTEPASDNEVRIENQHGEVQVFQAKVINILGDPIAAKATARFVTRAMQGAGLTAVSIDHLGEPLATADTSEAAWFGTVATADVLTDNLVQLWLNVESPVFTEGNKWKFSDGGSTFWAAIEDRAFLASVEAGRERFGKGDALLVDLRIRQSGTPKAQRLERVVATVLRHEIAPEQQSLI